MERDPLKARLGQLDGGRILDVATGHGAFLLELVDTFDTFSEAIGIDTSRERIGQARTHRRETVRFEVVNAEKTGYTDNYFDTVAIRHSLHHLRNTDAHRRDSGGNEASFATRWPIYPV
jgi:ubiquinone/menaquinone biosynthesis C-methylase UbiE